MKNFILSLIILFGLNVLLAQKDYKTSEIEFYKKYTSLPSIYPDFIPPIKYDVEKMPKEIEQSQYHIEDFLKFENSARLKEARNFEFGLNGQKNPYKAFEIYQLSAKHKDPHRPNAISLSWLLRRAKEGNVYAQYFLGVFFFEPKTSYIDDNRAFYWFKKSADKNYARALWALAHCYDRGIGVYRDSFVAFMLMRKAEVLLMLEENRPIKKIFSDEFASESENESLPKMLEIGAYVVKQEFYDKLNVFNEAVKFGDIYMAAYLARIYIEGIYLKKDMNKAIEFLNVATLGGHKTAPYVLGLCYLLGDGVKKDEKKALEYFEIADANGYPTIDYARCYIEGWGTEKDDKKALEILTRVFNDDEYLANLVFEGFQKNGELRKIPVIQYQEISQRKNADNVWQGCKYFDLD